MTQQEGSSLPEAAPTMSMEQPGRPLPLEPSRDELLQCQFSSWFPTFRHLPPEDDREDGRTNVTIKSKIISPLPAKFTEFLLADGIRLPEGATKLSSCAPNEVPRKEDEDDDDNNWEEGDAASSPKQFSFPELNQQIQEAIEELGGSVMPKLNWSAPKDATWVNEGTLKCKTPGDVYLLLKSSDFCLHDLQLLQQQQHQAPLQLVLRKWCNFYPSMEFRCFVRNHNLIGISQRNHSQHYPHLLLDRSRIRSFVVEFFHDIVCHRFANNQLANYVFDVYVDKSDRVWLVDLNVWSIQTDALLYSWEELVDLQIPLLVGEEQSDSWPELRVVETSLEVRQDPLSSYRAPMDTVALASSSSNNNLPHDAAATSFESFMAMCQKPSERQEEDETSSDEEEE